MTKTNTITWKIPKIKRSRAVLEYKRQARLFFESILDARRFSIRVTTTSCTVVKTFEFPVNPCINTRKLALSLSFSNRNFLHPETYARIIRMMMVIRCLLVLSALVCFYKLSASEAFPRSFNDDHDDDDLLNDDRITWPKEQIYGSYDDDNFDDGHIPERYRRQSQQNSNNTNDSAAAADTEEPSSSASAAASPTAAPDNTPATETETEGGSMIFIPQIAQLLPRFDEFEKKQSIYVVNQSAIVSNIFKNLDENSKTLNVTLEEIKNDGNSTIREIRSAVESYFRDFKTRLEASERVSNSLLKAIYQQQMRFAFEGVYPMMPPMPIYPFMPVWNGSPQINNYSSSSSISSNRINDSSESNHNPIMFTR